MIGLVFIWGPSPFIIYQLLFILWIVNIRENWRPSAEVKAAAPDLGIRAPQKEDPDRSEEVAAWLEEEMSMLMMLKMFLFSL